MSLIHGILAGIITGPQSNVANITFLCGEVEEVTLLYTRTFGK